MPDTAPNEPKPIVPEVVSPKGTPAPAQEFDLLAFWIQYRKLIIRVTVLLLIIVGVWGTIEFLKARKENQSKESLATATTADQLRKVIADWPGTPAGGSAHLLLASKLREDGKFDDAVKVLKDFSAQYPDHPLASNAVVSLGITYECAGKKDEALAAYRQMATSYPSHSLTPMALIGQARILMAQGKRDEAQKIADDLKAKYGNSVFTRISGAELIDDLKNPSGNVFGGNARPAEIKVAEPLPAPPSGNGMQGLPPELLRKLNMPPGVQVVPGGGAPAPRITIPAPVAPAPGPSIPAPAPAPAPAPNPRATAPSAPAPAAPKTTEPAPATPAPAPVPAPKDQAPAPAPASPATPAPAPAAPSAPGGDQASK